MGKLKSRLLSHLLDNDLMLRALFHLFYNKKLLTHTHGTQDDADGIKGGHDAPRVSGGACEHFLKQGKEGVKKEIYLNIKR